MDPHLSPRIEKYTKKTEEIQKSWTLEELLETVIELKPSLEIRAFLEAHPHLLLALKQVVRQARLTGHHHLETAAYFKYRDREARHQLPLRGKELDDWLAAEAEAPLDLEKNLEELRTMADDPVASVGSSSP
jgi:hypothetical protein